MTNPLVYSPSWYHRNNILGVKDNYDPAQLRRQLEELVREQDRLWIELMEACKKVMEVAYEHSKEK